jgi:hypothetical protein
MPVIVRKICCYVYSTKDDIKYCVTVFQWQCSIDISIELMWCGDVSILFLKVSLANWIIFASAI